VTRGFVAVRLPEGVLDAIAQATSLVSVPGRVTTRDQWHLTLQFLGDDADIEAVTGALRGLAVDPGRVALGGAGAFPDARHARVLWLGTRDGDDVVSRLADAVCARTAPLGHERDPRPFRAHITLARFRAPIDARAVIDRFGADAVGPSFDVEAVTVYESRRDARGASYTERATIPLPR